MGEAAVEVVVKAMVEVVVKVVDNTRDFMVQIRRSHQLHLHLHLRLHLSLPAPCCHAARRRPMCRLCQPMAAEVGPC
jgi:murein endopeptidase